MEPDEFKRLREGMGLTQQALADQLGVHRVTVAKWEAGDRGIPEPAARLLQRLHDEARPKKKRRK